MPRPYPVAQLSAATFWRLQTGRLWSGAGLRQRLALDGAGVSELATSTADDFLGDVFLAVVSNGFILSRSLASAPWRRTGQWHGVARLDGTHVFPTWRPPWRPSLAMRPSWRLASGRPFPGARPPRGAPPMIRTAMPILRDVNDPLYHLVRWLSDSVFFKPTAMQSIVEEE